MSNPQELRTDFTPKELTLTSKQLKLSNELYAYLCQEVNKGTVSYFTCLQYMVKKIHTDNDLTLLEQNRKIAEQNEKIVTLESQLKMFKSTILKLAPWCSAGMDDKNVCQKLKDIFTEVMELEIKFDNKEIKPGDPFERVFNLSKESK